MTRAPSIWRDVATGAVYGMLIGAALLAAPYLFSRLWVRWTPGPPPPAVAAAPHAPTLREDPRVVVLEDLEHHGGELAALALQRIATAGRRPVLVIRSPGGHLDEAETVGRTLEALARGGVDVTCVVDQEAASAAVYVLEACPIRVVTRWATVTLHHVRIPMTVDVLPAGIWPRLDLRELRRDADQADVAYQEYVLRHSTISRAELQRRLGPFGEWVLIGDELVRRGLADRVVPSVADVLAAR